jgi:PAS domain S-box-containing protein
VQLFTNRGPGKPRNSMRSDLLRYGGACVLVALAVLVTLTVPAIHEHTPALLVSAAVIISGIVAGLGPGLLAVALATMALLIWLAPASVYGVLGDSVSVQVVAFVAVTSGIVILLEARRRAEARLDEERELVLVAQELSLDAFIILQAVRDAAGTIVDFRWTYINPAAAAILKHEREELVGQQLLKVMPGNKQNSDVFERYVKVVETGQPHKIELAYDADGIQGWFRNMAVKLGDGVAVSFADITARKQYEQQLAYQAFLLANMSDAVIAVDRDFNITRWNKGAETLYGWKEEEVLGRPLTEVVQATATPEVRQAALAAAEAETQHTFHVVHHNRQGQQVYGDAVMRALRENDGSITGYIIINHDVTERRRHEEELIELNASLEERVRERTAELQRSNEELDRFAYVASHDLKAPLRAIANLATWIEEDGAEPSPAVQAHLAKLSGRIRRMDKLLDDLLTYSRAGRVWHEPAFTDTQVLVQEAVEFLNVPPGFGVEVVGRMPTLYTERVPLATVFRNLIENAYKHHDRPDCGCVRISAEEQADAVVFAVADDGPGIEPQYHERIFGVYQTLKPRDEVEGSGIGLAVVKKIVESRGGAVAVHSAVGAGSTFYITWPKQEAPADGEVTSGEADGRVNCHLPAP